MEAREEKVFAWGALLISNFFFNINFNLCMGRSVNLLNTHTPNNGLFYLRWPLVKIKIQNPRIDGLNRLGSSRSSCQRFKAASLRGWIYTYTAINRFTTVIIINILAWINIYIIQPSIGLLDS